MSASDPANYYLSLLVERVTHDADDAIVRNAVQLRARDVCEYCLMPTYGQYHVDHIIPKARWTAYTAKALPLVSAASGGYVKRSSGFWGRMPPPLAPEAGG